MNGRFIGVKQVCPGPGIGFFGAERAAAKNRSGGYACLILSMIIRPSSLSKNA